MVSPVSLVVSAFASIDEVAANVTPALAHVPSNLVLVDLGPPQQGRVGGSILSAVLAKDKSHDLGAVPDLDAPEHLAKLMKLCWSFARDGLVLACHDRSDGGLIATVFEMALAGHCGVSLSVPASLAPQQVPTWLFNEELGVVLQVAEEQTEAIVQALDQAGLGAMTSVIGKPCWEGEGADRLVLSQLGPSGGELYQQAMGHLAQIWSTTSHQITRLRDNPDCADQAFAAIGDWSRGGLMAKLSFEPPQRPIRRDQTHSIRHRPKPSVAILREQGINGQREMAQSFLAAGFDAVDVTLSDLLAGRQRLEKFRGLAVCGGFSYGDVLGAGLGFARSILYDPGLRLEFEEFFADPTRFGLGVCNGCQMLSALRPIIPGTAHWPDFRHNLSQQFEARLSLVRIEDSPSLFFQGMAGSVLPVVTAHGEGQAIFARDNATKACVSVRYVDSNGIPTQAYPDNPNGSVAGVTGLSNDDGRITILMPHPERLLRYENYSWALEAWKGRSPWAMGEPTGTTNSMSDNMPNAPKENAEEEYLGGNAVRQMFILALLYLPLGFFLWFFAASLLMYPTQKMVAFLFTSLYPDVFSAVVQLDFYFEIQTLITLAQQVEGQSVALNIEVNPMIYAWGMALLFGLIMATPLNAKTRIVQMVVGFLVVSAVTSWGVFWDTLTQLAFRSGPEAAMAARGLGIPMDMIALFYQLGYLMLPAVIPVATWILLNRGFIETHVVRHRS